MGWFKKLLKKIDGYKVYLLGAAGIITLLAALASGEMGLIEFAKALWAILIGMAGRSALKKIGTLA